MNGYNRSEHQILCKWLVNCEQFSDVQFLVGPDKDLVHAHKMILASGSPVFEKYFYADHDLKMNAEPIEVPDLSIVGFINMMKYFYGYQVSELDLSKLFETYVAADKYLAHGLNEKLLEQIKNTLDTSNCCLVYDQLLKLQREDVLQLNYLRKMIQYNAAAAFKSESFTKIDLHTLVDVLELDTLNIDEVDVLKACLRWTEMECSRNGWPTISANVREVFKAMKHRICFTNLSIEQIKEFDQIEKLLNNDEIGSLFIHLLNKSKKLAIECKPWRKKCELCTVTDFGELIFKQFGQLGQFVQISFTLNVNHHVWIKTIQTHLETDVQNLSLSISENDKQVQLKSAHKFLPYSSKWNFRFAEFLQIAPNRNYKFSFKFTANHRNCKLSKKTELIFNSNSTEMKTRFNLKLDSDFHCIEKIEYYGTP